ncbi:MAG: potassium channel family protein [Propionicimonas sp.]|nr:potassium channel family protein [Propionicimonas sp.]
MHWRSIVNQVALPLAILSFYFVIPVGDGNEPLGRALGIAVAGLCIAAVVWVIVDEARRAGGALSPMHLLIAFELVWVTFALTYFLIATSRPGEFTGLSTRLDALYFSLTTMSTVGYGDVSAQGQFARAVVTIQLAFNLAFVGGVVAVFQDMVKRNGARRRQLRRSRRDATTTPVATARTPAEGEGPE